MYTIDSYFDKVFYLNLDKDIDRNESMIQQFKKYNISNYERVSGIVFDEISDKIHWRNFNTDRLTRKYILGGMGCRSAHHRAMEIAIERNYQRIIVFEDDAIMLDDPNKILNMNQDILSNWDMLYFGGMEEHHFNGQIICAHAYAMNRKLIEEAYVMMPCSGMEVDNFYAKILYHMSYNYNTSGKYNVRKMMPFNTIIQNKNFESNIQS